MKGSVPMTTKGTGLRCGIVKDCFAPKKLTNEPAVDFQAASSRIQPVEVIYDE
ncbi:MAG: hypothetical protein OXH57_01895 [Ekhidna sp.]|nr:hypothetical protein [Ekhidna sp.]